MARITFVPDLACTGPTDETVARIESTVKVLDDKLERLTAGLNEARESMERELASIKEKFPRRGYY